MRWVLDLDGVVWLAGRPIPGAAEAVDRLRSQQQSVVFVTNNSGPTRRRYVEMLAGAGIEAAEEELVTSAQAAASLFAAGDRVAVVGDDGVVEALGDRRVNIVDPTATPTGVVVGRTLTLDHDRLASAMAAIRAGARFVATNTDATFPTPEGLLPGAGALVAYLATAAGRQPEVAGKPHQPVADLVRDRYGAVDVMVGDRPDTDGLFAARIEARFALVLSGVTERRDLPVTPPPDTVGDDLAAIIAELL